MSISDHQQLLMKCSRQTELLFDMFYSLPAKEGDEVEEVHQAKYSYVERDGALQSSNDFAQVNTRSPVHAYDSNRHKRDLIVKRRSLELELKRRSAPLIQVTPVSQSSHPADDFTGHPRARAQSVGPTEQQLKDAALTIAAIGDQIEENYGDRLLNLRDELVQYVSDTGRDLTYEQFAVHINELIGEDRNWTNFMFAFHLGKRVAQSTQSITANTFSYFRRFIGAAFAETIAANEDVVQFVQHQENA